MVTQRKPPSAVRKKSNTTRLRKRQNGMAASRVYKLKALAERKKVPFENIYKIEQICRSRQTTVEKIPAWLLRKSPRRVLYWFETGK